MMIGMFAVSEVLRFVVSDRQGPLTLAQEKIGNVFRASGNWCANIRWRSCAAAAWAR